MTDDDGVSNPSKNESFQEVVAARLSRRSFLGGSVAAATLALGGVGSLLRALPAQAHGSEAAARLHRHRRCRPPIPSSCRRATRPESDRLGRPVSDGPAFSQDASNTADEQAQQWGMHNDGVVYFPIDGSRHGLLVQNHEYTDDGLLFPDGVANWTAEKTSKSLNAHGVSVIEIRSRVTERRQTGTASGASCARRIRPAHHRPDTDPDRRARRRRPAARDERGPDRPARARHAEQLRHGLHAVGHLPGLRGELQRLLPKNPRQPDPAGAAVRHRRRSAPAFGCTPPTRGSTPTSSRTSPTASAGSSRSIRSSPSRRR